MDRDEWEERQAEVQRLRAEVERLRWALTTIASAASGHLYDKRVARWAVGQEKDAGLDSHYRAERMASQREA